MKKYIIQIRTFLETVNIDHVKDTINKFKKDFKYNLNEIEKYKFIDMFRLKLSGTNFVTEEKNVVIYFYDKDVTPFNKDYIRKDCRIFGAFIMGIHLDEKHINRTGFLLGPIAKRDWNEIDYLAEISGIDVDKIILTTDGKLLLVDVKRGKVITITPDELLEDEPY